MENKTTNKSKSNTSKKNSKNSSKKSGKKTGKKPKLYIPAYKIIAVCVAVITVCMILLLITTLTPASEKTDKGKNINTVTTITERFQQDKKTTDEKDKTSETKTPVKTTGESNKSTVSEKNQIKETAKESISNTQKNTVTTSSKTETKSVEQKKTVETITKKETAAKQTEKTQPVKTEPKTVTINVHDDTPPKPVEKTTPKAKTYDIPNAVNNAQLVFVFDDGGQNLAHLDKFLNLPFPVTIAVLPQLVHSKESAAKVRASGNELMLHQPMQSVNNSVNPGPGAITPDMSEDQIITTLFRNINEIGPVAGLNNHEGSAITADAEKMAIVLRTASENGIFFLDSRTNVKTQVPYVAGELGYSYYARNIFLDNEKNKDNVMTELLKGLTLANKNGVVIMIGHVWSADFLPEILREIYPELIARGYTFSVVSKCKGLKY